MKTFFDREKTKGAVLPFLAGAVLLLGSFGLIYFMRLKKDIVDQDKNEAARDLVDPDRLPVLSEEEIKSVVQGVLIKDGRFGSEPDFELTGWRRLSWPDGSLGCPKPGMAYTQQVVPGYRAEALINGERIEIHIDALRKTGLICKTLPKNP